MPYRKEQFDDGKIYHVIMRALDDNLIFKDTDDYFRGIFSIYEFNDSNPANIFNRRRDRIIEKRKEKKCEVGFHTNLPLDARDRFVDILVFCFMPNHIHLLLKQIKTNGISKFMQKVGGGYARHFNKKYSRKGHVFQDVFKSVMVKDDKQLLTVFNYIHVNPLSLIEPRWKEKGIKNVKKYVNFLEEYKWSSLQDYIGKKNFPSVTSRKFLLETIGGITGCRNAVKSWLEYKKAVLGDNELFLD